MEWKLYSVKGVDRGVGIRLLAEKTSAELLEEEPALFLHPLHHVRVLLSATDQVGQNLLDLPIRDQPREAEED